MKFEFEEYEKKYFDIIVNQYKQLDSFFTRRAINLIESDLIDIHHKEKQKYCIIAKDKDKVVGNLIFQRDFTGDNVYEFKWLATDAGFKYRPIIFKKLMNKGEEVLKNKARIFILYTSNTNNERNTQSIFLKLHYNKVAILPDFWDDGDDRVIFMKRNKDYNIKK